MKKSSSINLLAALIAVFGMWAAGEYAAAAPAWSVPSIIGFSLALLFALVFYAVMAQPAKELWKRIFP